MSQVTEEELEFLRDKVAILLSENHALHLEICELRVTLHRLRAVMERDLYENQVTH